MTTLVITCPELPERREAIEKHLETAGITSPMFINGIHAETFGLLCYKNYHHGKAGEMCPKPQSGLVLSHYMAWQVCEHLSEGILSWFMILEDDAKLDYGWWERTYSAMKDLPADWDIFLIGSSHTTDKPKERINGEVFEVKYPFCTHAYIVRKKAIPVLLSECRDCSMPIDILLIAKAYPKLKVYTLLPRCVQQRGLDLPE